MRALSDAVKRCRDYASAAIELACKNPIERPEYLKVAEEWLLKAYALEAASGGGKPVESKAVLLPEDCAQSLH